MVVEIPRGANAKLEISRDEPLNPIKQDVKNGKLRYVHDKYPFNYGALPQTWENPTLKHPDTGALGDNDPIDACEISSIQHQTGEVVVVKIIGTYAMIDEGETDWKIVCIDIKDPLAEKINDIGDLEKFMPGKAQQVFTFLRDYKIPDGKPPNVFAFDGALKPRNFAIQIAEETHHEWKQLITGATPNKATRYTIATANVSVTGSSYLVSKDEADKAAIDAFTKYIRAKN
jgi:inorganic pyrophosphatase